MRSEEIRAVGVRAVRKRLRSRLGWLDDGADREALGEEGCLVGGHPSAVTPGPLSGGGGLCGVAVFVDQAAEPVDPFDLLTVVRAGWRLRGWQRDLEADASVRPVRVVVLDVDGEGVLEVAAVADQQPVEAFGADRADSAFGVGVRLRCPRRGADHSDAVGGEDVVERGGELRVAVADQQLEPAPACALISICRSRASWATQAPLGFAVTPASHTRRRPSSMTNRT